jgi:hypothetical protein
MIAVEQQESLSTRRAQHGFARTLADWFISD